jgi:uncharacterized glyoxalase superfamily protein PhnB
MSVKPIPEGFHTITPYLMINDAASFIHFLVNAFGAKEIFTHKFENGKIMHAEVKIGDSMIMLSDAGDQYPALPGNYYLYVEEVDSVYKQAIAAGAESTAEPKDQFYGDRTAGVKDKFGITWWIGTHVEDVSMEEMKKREEEAKKSR